MYNGHGSPVGGEPTRAHARNRGTSTTRESHLDALARESENLAHWVHRRFNPSTLSIEDARDATQEAFAEATRRSDVVADDRDRYRAWLRKVAYHRAIDHVRRRDGEERYGGRRALPVSLNDLLADDATGTVPPPLRTSDVTAEAVAQLDEDRQRAVTLAMALRALDEQEREAIRLRYLEGVSVQRCSEAMGLSKPQYERIRARALTRLRRQLTTARDAST
jgi:RNA polymerase sigma-70 factor, ECF subfamily